MQQKGSAPPGTDERPPPRPAMHSPRAWYVLVVALLLGLVADLGSKALAFRYVAPHPVAVQRERVVQTMRDDPRALQVLVPAHRPRTIIPHVLDLQLVLNSGAVFGTGQGLRWQFIGFTAIVLVFVGYVFARHTRAGDHLTHGAIGLVLSGGLGNLYDRVVFACVRDFLHPFPGVKLPFGLRWPNGSDELWPWVSNVADALLLVGIGVLVFRLWRSDAVPAPRPAAAVPSGG